MLDVLATGYPSLDHIIPVSHLPSPGQTALLGATLASAQADYGGCGANVAVGLQRLGFQSGVAMVLGDDVEGERYQTYLRAAGVDCQNLLRLAATHTSSSYLFRAPDGEMTNFFYPGAADAWRGDLRLMGLDKVRWGLVTVGYAPYNRAFVAQMVAAHIPLIWQLKADIAAYPREVLAQFVTASKVLFCNRLEADYLLHGLGLQGLAEIFAFGVEQIIVTLGSAGSQVLTPNATYTIPILPVSVVDTTGAGDGYTVGYLLGFWRGYDPQVCGQLGATVSSFVIEAVGCQTNLPNWQQLHSRYEGYFGAL